MLTKLKQIFNNIFSNSTVDPTVDPTKESKFQSSLERWKQLAGVDVVIEKRNRDNESYNYFYDMLDNMSYIDNVNGNTTSEEEQKDKEQLIVLLNVLNDYINKNYNFYGEYSKKEFVDNLTYLKHGILEHIYLHQQSINSYDHHYTPAPEYTSLNLRELHDEEFLSKVVVPKYPTNVVDSPFVDLLNKSSLNLRELE